MMTNAMRLVTLSLAVCSAALLGCAQPDRAERADLTGPAPASERSAAPTRKGQMPSETNPDKPATGLLFRQVRVGADTRRYAVYVPRDYAPGTPTPTIVFLNGRGECGGDGAKQAVVGLGSAALLQSDKWPFIIVFPQKPDFNTQWVDHEDLVLATLDATQKEFNVDRTRTYLTGLSQGGAGTWAIGSRRAELFAAIAPVCGYGEPAKVAAGLRGMPIWAFHGEKDDVVLPAQTRALVAAVEAQGGPIKPKATYFPDANHNSWDPAYRTQDLGAWLLQHRREGALQPVKSPS